MFINLDHTINSFSPVKEVAFPEKQSSLKEQLTHLSSLMSLFFSTDEKYFFKTNQKIVNLSEQITKTKEKIKRLDHKIFKLKGGKHSNSLLSNVLVKSFFQYHNKQSLSLKKNHRNHLKEKWENLNKKLEEYRVEEREVKENNKRLFDSSFEDLSQQIHFDPLELDSCLGQELFTVEELELIFDLEYSLRQFLVMETFPAYDKYQKIYDQKIQPLLNHAKQFITQRSAHFATQAAASKGKAARVGFQALQRRVQSQPIIVNSKVSNQAVFLLSEEDAIFKRFLNARAREEEGMVNDLFDLMSKQAVVGTFTIQEASTDRFGIQVEPQFKQRSYRLDELSFALRHSIEEKLGRKDRLVLKKYERASQAKIEGDLQNYQVMATRNWQLQLSDGEWRTVNLKELQALYLKDKLTEETKVGESVDQAKTLKEHTIQVTPFFKALNYFPTLAQSPKPLYFIPDLRNPMAKQAYEKCEQFQWIYREDDESKHPGDFKTIHAKFLQGLVSNINHIRPLSSKAISSTPTEAECKIALNVRWKATTLDLEEVIQENTRFPSLEKIVNIQAKPFIKNMYLVSEIARFPRACQTIFDRLTPDAEFNALLTGELQLLDLHEENLAVAPQPNEHYEKFKSLTFTIDSQKKSFKELIIDYLEENINENKIIKYEEKGTSIKQPLKNLPDLQAALAVNWQFVIFDTDLCLAESNYLQLQTMENEEQHVIPLRSVLLEMNWKDKLLSEETIQRLLNSSERDFRVQHWIAKKDAPIRKRLSQETQQKLDQKLKFLLEDYSLSFYRYQNNIATIVHLQAEFVNELIASDYSEIWKLIEHDLSLVTIQLSDSWETIAQRYKQNIQDLKKLNSLIQLNPGQKVKINYDLTSNSPEALTKRKKLAMQLFPRLTIAQQCALLERQQRRKNYLESYRELKHSSLQEEALIKQLKEYIKKPETPLSSIKRKKLLKELKIEKNKFIKDSIFLNKFKEEICQMCQPTYFNLMKAMYPLLADVYALNLSLYGQKEAGRKIGLYTHPLELTLLDMKKAKFKEYSPEYFLLMSLKKQIKELQDPSFFGHW